MSQAFAIENAGNGCIRVIRGTLTPHMIRAYDQDPKDPNLWCLRKIKFTYQLDGSIKFTRKPPKCPGNYNPTDDPLVFAPDFPPCQHRRLESKMKPSCGCVSVLWHCDKFKTLADVQGCKTCISDNKNGDANGS